MSGRGRAAQRSSIVVLDANVLVPNALRDTLLRCAEAGLYDVRWSTETLVELERTLVGRIFPEQAGRDGRVRRLLAAMQEAFPLAQVREEEAVIARMRNDPKDRHVLAAAVQCRASMIVTFNRRDFPTAALREHRVVAKSPDQFLGELFEHRPARLIAILTAQGRELRQPLTLEAILDTLEQHAPSVISRLRTTPHEPV